jgi:hypothetical protein
MCVAARIRSLRVGGVVVLEYTVTGSLIVQLAVLVVCVLYIHTSPIF